MQKTVAAAGAAPAAPPKVDVVVFHDYDDNLAQTERVALTSAWKLTNEVLAGQGVGPMEQADFLTRFVGKSYALILQQVQTDYRFSLPAERVEELVREEEQRALVALGTELSPTPGAMRALAELQRLGVEQAVVSSSSLRRLAQCLSATGQAEYFPDGTVFSARDSVPGMATKPDPAVYRHAMAIVGKAAVFVGIEDSKSGMQALAGAGVMIRIGNVGALEGQTARAARAQQLFDVGAQIVVSDLAALPRIVESLQSGAKDLTAFMHEFGPSAWVK